MVRVSVVIVVLSNPNFVWLFLSHFINFEGSRCSQVFSPYLQRLASIPSIAWPWFCECPHLLFVVGMMGCMHTKWARVEGGYLNYNHLDLNPTT
jgi:hypothetical protein